jgi:hypothetical protein
MKTLGRNQPAKSFWNICLPFCTTMVAGIICRGDLPLTTADESAKAATATAAPRDQAFATNQPPAAAITAGVSEILRLADAGISTEVIKTYIECSSTSLQPTDADIIALKQHHVADDVVTLLMKRGAQVRVVAEKTRNEAEIGAISASRMASGGLDPDSYDYFQYFYLQPRAQAAVNQRLSPYGYPSFPQAYGYSSFHGFGPSFSSRSAYHRHPGNYRGRYR